MPTVAISPFFNSHHHDNNGNPASGWLVYTYYSRTTQKKDTYKDPQGISKHENPITLDARGEYPGGGLFLIAGETYSIVLKDPNSGTEKTWHSVIGGSGGVVPIATSHTDLSNRDIADQHPTGAITNLDTLLADKVSKSTTNYQIIKSILMLDPNESDSCNVFINGGNQSTNTSAYFAVNSNTGNIRVVAPTNEIPYIGLGTNSVVNSEKIEIKNSNGDYIRITATDIIKNGVSLISGESIS